MAPQNFDLAAYNAEVERQLAALRAAPDYHKVAMDVMNTPTAQAAPATGGSGGLLTPMLLGAKVAPHLTGGTVSGIGPVADGSKYAAMLGNSGSAAGTVSGIGPVASGAEYSSMLGNGGATLASMAPYLGLFGVGAGGAGLYNALQSHDSKSGALSGAALGGGLAAAAPLLGLGPVGWAGLGIASLLGAGGGAGLAALSGMGDKDQFKTEYKRAQKLRDSGINWNRNAESPQAGRSKQQLIDEAMANGGNVDFAKTRDEKYLTGKDLVGYSFLPEKFGNAYAGAGLDKQIKAAQMIADAKAVDERKGSMFFNKTFTPELEAKISAFLGGNSSPSVASKVGTVTPYSQPARSRTSSPGISKDGKRISYAKAK